MDQISASEQLHLVPGEFRTSRRLPQGRKKLDGYSWSSMLADFYDFRSLVSEPRIRGFDGHAGVDFQR